MCPVSPSYTLAASINSIFVSRHQFPSFCSGCGGCTKAIASRTALRQLDDGAFAVAVVASVIGCSSLLLTEH